MMANQTKQKSEAELSLQSIPSECSFPLKNVSFQRMTNLMNQSCEEIDDLIAANMEKLDESLNAIKVTATSKIQSISSSGDGGKLEVPPFNLEKLDIHKEKINFPMPSSGVKTAMSRISNFDSLFYNSAPLRPLVAANSVMGKVTSGMAMSRMNLVKILDDNAAAFRMSTNVNDQKMYILQSAIDTTADITVLDFRTLNNFLEKPSSHKSQRLVMHQTIEELEILTSLNKASGSTVDFAPPNEFDWFSFERMNSILPLSTASQVFSILNDSNCKEQLKELYINATSEDDDDRPCDDCEEEECYYDFDKNIFPKTLSCLENLTKLVLRGMCRDDMLQSIGQNCHYLTHLDISGSREVSDVGIQNLVFRERIDNSALFMIPAWILKNFDKMNPLVSKLTYLDYSLTSVTTISRKIFQLLPGCYLFKRLTSTGEEDDFGHHIFIKRAAVLLQSSIPPKLTPTPPFLKQLIETVGIAGARSFAKLVESHPWKRYFLTLYSHAAHCNLDPVGILDRHVWGIVTPNQNERRIQGIVHWHDGILTQIYTIYPINLNLLGNLNTLRVFQGIVHGSWRTQFSLLPDLVQIDIFTEPKTLICFMQHCPNIKRMTIRIRGAALNDGHIMSTIRTSMCRSVLEEFWIAPAPAGSTLGTGGLSHVSSLSPSLCSSLTSFSGRIADDSFELPPRYDLTTGKFCTNDDLVQLSLNCLQTLITTCPNMKRVGDLATWSNVEEEELYMYCEQLKQKRHKIVITWANTNLPDSSGKKKRAKV